MSTSDPRRVIRVGGSDARDFLQGLITNDIARTETGLVYAALLTPQGKYLADFFVYADDDGYMIDVAEPLANALAQRLTMYRLRADVTIDPTDLTVRRGLGEPPEGAFPDPRHSDLGWRAYGADQDNSNIDWPALHVRLGVPTAGVELIPNDSYPLEMGFERLNGVDFRKGCYVGQEVTARMKHKTDLPKGLAVVSVKGDAPPGTEITKDGKTVGTLYTQSGDKGLAYLRFDRAGPDMVAGEAQIDLARDTAG